MSLKIFIVLVLSTTLLSACYHNESNSEKNSLNAKSLQLSGEFVDGVRVVKVEAFKFEFYPKNIVVQKGEKVKLILTSRDVGHGLLAKDLGINIKVNPNEESIAEFTADSQGSFPFRCNVYCGSGHALMKGLIIVK